MKKEFISIRNIIDRINELDEAFLYAKSDKIKNDENLLLIYGDEYTLPPETLEGFQYKMGIFQLRDIIENLKMQSGTLNIGTCVDAINYYLENDAFIDLNRI